MLPVRSVGKHHGYATWSRLATTRPWTCRAWRAKLERLCRYICRPPVSEKRLFLTARGDVGYSLKTPYRHGTTHVLFEPLDFIARLAALVPPPRLNLTRFHGVFAPNSPYRARITPARRGRDGKPKSSEPSEDRTPAEQRSAMRWAQRLKRVFRIDVETCPRCGGTVQIIASIEDPPAQATEALRLSAPAE
jgi:hypothetical protein